MNIRAYVLFLYAFFLSFFFHFSSFFLFLSFRCLSSKFHFCCFLFSSWSFPPVILWLTVGTHYVSLFYRQENRGWNLFFRDPIEKSVIR